MEKKKILIVDDEEGFTQMVKLNLEETGKYEVIVENKGKEAIFTAKKFKPDLIFLDIVMPDTDGGEIMQKMHSDEDLKDTPVVFLTALVTEKEVKSQEGIIAGHPFLAKPVTTQQLIECIEKYSR
ncbi:MAG: response regulator [Candidatus Omnitrophota bacterium]|nr:response regulator [Candidatus Omnitrophota bacterium]RKY32057.1 MAG: response regulator [Candidatus Omnitrophota bacterium]HDN85610.1 response regulator [Candidatus Omnitrophota bacterium]